MNQEQNIHRLKSATHKILNCGDQIGLMHQAVHEMYAVYCQYTPIDVSDQNNEDILLPSGKAISPTAAAHCLLEMVRTAKFLRGINEAINYKLQTTEKLEILYAGCGPYATLLTPLLHLLDPVKVQVDLLDINKSSFQSAVRLIKALGFDSFVENVYCTDATLFKAEKNYDIVISETMQAALKKEPQVAIMQHLIPQLPIDSIFIPEAITVSAALTSRGHWNAEIGLLEDVQCIELGNIFTVDKQHLEIEMLRNELVVPNEITGCTRFSLYTDIQVYGAHLLGENDCSLNMPLKLSEVNCTGGETIRFWYEQGEMPGICCQIKGNENIYRGVGRKNRPQYAVQLSE